MNYYAFLPLLNALFILVYGLNIYKNKPDRENLLFFICLLLISSINFVFFNLFQADSKGVIDFWSQFLSAWVLVIPFFFHFTVLFSESSSIRGIKYIVIAVYVLSAGIAVIEFHNSHFSWHVQKFDIIPAYHYTVKPFCFYLTRGFSVIVDAVILLLCIRRFRKGVNIIKRNLMKYVIIPIILIMGARILTFFNQEYNLWVIFIQYTFLFTPFIYIGFIKNRYGVYSRFTDLLFKEVFVIQDSIFLVLNNEDKIIFANPFFYRELGYEEDEILGYTISRFLVAKNEFRLQECDVDKFNILFSARDGSTKRIIVRVSTFKNERGRILYTVLVGDNRKGETDQKFLNICAYCKNVKISGLRWVRFEEYLSDHYDLQFTHGICPECYKVIVHKYSQDRT